MVFSNLELVNVSIIHHLCTTKLPGCIINAQVSSNISIQISWFENVQSVIEEGNIYLETSKIYFESSKMTLVKTEQNKGACVSGYYHSQFSANNSEFITYDNNCLFFSQSFVSINNSLFNNTEAMNIVLEYMDYGTFFCESCYQVLVDASFFIGNLKTINGSAIFISATQQDTLTNGEIYNSYFFNNQAFECGTISINDYNISIISNIFEKNFANEGGAIYSNNDSKSKSVLYIYNIHFVLLEKNLWVIINDNTFLNNMAFQEGGAIKWIGETPTFSNNVFFNNSAIYGANIASFPIRMTLRIYNSDDSENIDSPGLDENLMKQNFSLK